MRNKLYDPMIGFKDLYGFPKRLNEYIKLKMAEFFQRWGYDWIEPPIIEKASSFSEDIVGLSPWPEWDKRGCFYIKINDYQKTYNEQPQQQDGLLIPEGTISVARWIAKQLVENYISLPVKIFYITPCFRNELLSRVTETKTRQFDHVGLEIIGLHSKMADLECILLIAKGLEVIGLDLSLVRIRLGDVEIFNKLVEISKLSPYERVTAKEFLDAIAENRAKKDYEKERAIRDNMIDWLNEKVDNQQLRDLWIALTYKDGLYKLSEEDFVKQNLQYMEIIQTELNNLFGINAEIDASVVRSHEYYTNLVFEVDYLASDKVYVEIAGGGRYNKLIGKFTKGNILSIPATGFAYGVQRISKILYDARKYKTIDSVMLFLNEDSEDFIIASKSNNYYNAFEYAEKMREKGSNRVSIWLDDYKKVFERYRKTKIREVE